MAILSILFSFLFKRPFDDPKLQIYYTSFNFDTLISNLWPNLMDQTYRSLFSILFPLCIGILAGNDF